MTDLTDAQLVGVGRRVRALVCKWALSNPDVDVLDLDGGCAIASFALWQVLCAFGCDATLVCVEGDGSGSHCWVEYDGLAIDLTATQFDPKACPVTIHPADLQTYEGRRSEDNRALAATLTWSGQSPGPYRGRVRSLAYRMKRGVHAPVYLEA